MGLGIDTVGADTGGLIGVEWRDVLAKALPAAADVASSALADPKVEAAKAKAKAEADAAAAAAAAKASHTEESFFSKKIVGPVKVWMGLLGVVAAGGGIYLWKRK